MNIRLFAAIFLCAAAPAIAFPLGIRVGSGWNAKIGPSSPAKSAAPQVERHPVRVIARDTLDGQPIPGNADRSSTPSRDLSPVYPTSQSPEADLASSQGLAPTPPSEEAGTPADGVSAAAPQPQIIEEPRLYPDRAHRFGAWRHREYAYARHRRGWRWAYRGPYYSRRAWRGPRPSNPFAAFAGLFSR